MMVTRRSFLAGLGAVSVGLLFRRDGDTERTPRRSPSADRRPSAAEIIIRCDAGFQPDRLVVTEGIAPSFVVESIRIDTRHPDRPDPRRALRTRDPAAHARSGVVLALYREVRLRVHYVGRDPSGLPFRARLSGHVIDGDGLVRGATLPIDSIDPIVA